MRAQPTRADLSRVVSWFYGDVGAYAYEIFDSHNKQFFDGSLEAPLFRFELMAYGHAVAFFLASHTGKPLISIASQLPNGSWLISPDSAMKRGSARDRFIADVILHEMIHENVARLLNGKRESSHKGPTWIAEIQRIGDMLGFPDWEVGRYKTRRRPKAKGGGTYKGTPDGCVPYEEMFRFPHETWMKIEPNRYRDIPVREMAW